VGKRSSSKATYPGLLDVLAAGGQPRSVVVAGVVVVVVSVAGVVSVAAVFIPMVLLVVVG